MSDIGLSTSLPTLLEGGSDRGFRDLVQALLGLSSRMVDLREQIAKGVGLTGPQYSMLIAIHHLTARGVDVTVGVLAAQLHVSGTYATAESKKLEAQGKIKRFANPADRRSVVLRLTPSGRNTLKGILPMVCAINDALFAGLSARRFTALRAEITELLSASDEALLVAARELRRRQAP